MQATTENKGASRGVSMKKKEPLLLLNMLNLVKEVFSTKKDQQGNQATHLLRFPNVDMEA